MGQPALRNGLSDGGVRKPLAKGVGMPVFPDPEELEPSGKTSTFNLPPDLLAALDRVAEELNARLEGKRGRGVRRWNRTRVVIQLLRHALRTYESEKAGASVPPRPSPATPPPRRGRG